MSDPLGRSTEFQRTANNGIDLIEARQTTGGTSQRLVAITYNAQHLPLTVTGLAAVQVTAFGYNGRGQLTTITNAKSEVTTFIYDTNAYLVVIDGPLPTDGDQPHSPMTLTAALARSPGRTDTC